jgi:hypothetical protein
VCVLPSTRDYIDLNPTGDREMFEENLTRAGLTRSSRKGDHHGNVGGEETAVRPFRFDVPEEDLYDLRRRIGATQWPDKRSEPHSGRFAS